MGLDPYPPTERRDTSRRDAATASIDLRRPVELGVLSVKQKAARCRLLGGDRIITLRASRLWDVVPARKQWTYAGAAYLSGVIEPTRIEASALGLVPLKLEDRGTSNPREHDWGEDGAPIGEWAKPIIAQGPRREFEMERVLPGEDSEDPFSDARRPPASSTACAG